MLLMYSILNWSSGLASGTGGIKVLIADTIVYKAEVVREREKTSITQDKYRQNVIVSLYNQGNGIDTFNLTTEKLSR